MGELLRLYLGPSGKASNALWLGAARVIDPRPVLSGSFAASIAGNLGFEEVTAAGAWRAVGDELRDAMEHSGIHVQEKQGK